MRLGPLSASNKICVKYAYLLIDEYRILRSTTKHVTYGAVTRVQVSALSNKVQIVEENLAGEA